MLACRNPRGFFLVTMLLLLAILALGILAMPGCAYVPTSQQTVVDAQALNAQSFDAKIQQLTAPVDQPTLDLIKQWSAAESQSWQAVSAWAHNRAPPATQP